MKQTGKLEFSGFAELTIRRSRLIPRGISIEDLYIPIEEA